MATRLVARGGPVTQGFVSKESQTLASRCAASSVGMSAKRTMDRAPKIVNADLMKAAMIESEVVA